MRLRMQANPPAITGIHDGRFAEGMSLSTPNPRLNRNPCGYCQTLHKLTLARRSSLTYWPEIEQGRFREYYRMNGHKFNDYSKEG